MGRSSRWLVFLPVALFALLPQQANAEPQPGLNAIGYTIDEIPPIKSDDTYPTCGDEIENNIEAMLDGEIVPAKPENIGRAKRIDDALGRYGEYAKTTFPAGLRLDGLKVVIDCANGAAYHTAPHVFHELGAEVIAIGIPLSNQKARQCVGRGSDSSRQRGGETGMGDRAGGHGRGAAQWLDAHRRSRRRG